MSNFPPPLPPSTPPSFIPPPMPPAPRQPEIVGAVLDNLEQKTGAFSKQAFRLVITDKRLIFALQKKNTTDYARQDPSITLAENPANFAIPIEQVIKVETYSAGMDDPSPDYMIVFTPAQKYRFNIRNYY